MNYPPGAKYDPRAPWNQQEPEYETGQCPNCESKNTFEATVKIKGRKCSRYVCRNCWTKFE